MTEAKKSSLLLCSERLAMYLRIGEILVSLRMTYYGSNFPDMLEVYSFLTTVNSLLGTDKKGAFVCRQLPVFVDNRPGFSEQCQSGPYADSNVNQSSRYRDAGNGFFVREF